MLCGFKQQVPVSSWKMGYKGPMLQMQRNIGRCLKLRTVEPVVFNRTTISVKNARPLLAIKLFCNIKRDGCIC